MYVCVCVHIQGVKENGWPNFCYGISLSPRRGKDHADVAPETLPFRGAGRVGKNLQYVIMRHDVLAGWMIDYFIVNPE